MCRRIIQHRTIPFPPEIMNPGSVILTLRHDPEDEEPTEERTHWGLQMSDRYGNTRLIYNARAETVHQKPTFRSAMQARRLAVPVEGFYEFPQNRPPVAFHRSNGDRMLLAGLWQPRKAGPGCVIITQTANSVVKPHHHRMPALLAEQHLEEWLYPDTPQTRLRQLLRPTQWTTVDAEPEATPAAALL